MSEGKKRKRLPVRYGISAYGWYGGPYWGPGGSGQMTTAQPPLSPDQFGSAGGTDAGSTGPA